MKSGHIRIVNLFVACVMTCAVVFFSTAHAGDILARVQSNGVVRCGVSEGIAGFSIFASMETTLFSCGSCFTAATGMLPNHRN